MNQFWFNSSTLSAAYMRQLTVWALAQIMACHLYGTKPLSEPMLTYIQLDPQKQNSVNFESKYKSYHSRKCIWKCCLRNSSHFVQGEMSSWWDDGLASKMSQPRCRATCFIVLYRPKHNWITGPWQISNCKIKIFLHIFYKWIYKQKLPESLMLWYWTIKI